MLIRHSLINRGGVMGRLSIELSVDDSMGDDDEA